MHFALEIETKLSEYAAHAVQLEPRPYSVQPYCLKLYTTTHRSNEPLAIERRLWDINKTDEEWKAIVDSMIAEIPRARIRVAKRVSEARYRFVKGEI